MTDIDNLAASAYADSTEPLKWAESITENLLFLHDEITAGRAVDPASFPGVPGDFSREGTARRIVGALLNAGWTPPTAEQIRDRSRQVAVKLRATAARLRAGDVPADLAENVGPEMFATAAQRDRFAGRLEDHAAEIDARWGTADPAA